MYKDKFENGPLMMLRITSSIIPSVASWSIPNLLFCNFYKIKFKKYLNLILILIKFTNDLNLLLIKLKNCLNLKLIKLENI